MSAPGLQEEAIFHITHWKAGSQWVRAVLTSLASSRFVPVKPDMSHVLQDPIRPGGVYTPVYLDKPSFECAVDAPHRRFVVIRDLRDTLVSWYFSLRYSHNPNNSVRDFRAALADMDTASGLEYLIEHRFDHMAALQSSWLGGSELVIRYEDLLADEFATFRRICDHCQLEAGDGDLRAALDAHSFERKSGRQRGQEDAKAHYRKGVAGDWKNHFRSETKAHFKRKFGWVLVQSGYEEGQDW
jgi:hypothetical protein